MSKSFLTVLLTGLLFFSACQDDNPINAENGNNDVLKTGTAESLTAGGRSEYAVVANRASGSISVIDMASDSLIDTHTLPGDSFPEPMYVVWSKGSNRVFVGDRANDAVVVFNGNTFSVEASVPAGEGVFHMWMNRRETQLWVNNDVDNTATVINPHTLQVLATVPMPADLVAQGGFPHDVILEPKGRFAYVTMLGLPGASDYVVQFNTTTFTESKRVAVGKDPHLSLTTDNKYLYVPCQNSNSVFILHRKTLAVVDVLTVEGAHGAGFARKNGDVFYTTNLPGGGTNGLVAIATETHTVIGAVDTPFPVPHNLALAPFGDKLYLTHSGATANQVTVWEIDAAGLPVFLNTVETGLNPFGIAFSRSAGH